MALAIEEVASGTIIASNHKPQPQRSRPLAAGGFFHSSLYGGDQHEREQDRKTRSEPGQFANVADRQTHGGAPANNKSAPPPHAARVELARLFLFQLFFRELAIGSILGRVVGREE